MNSPIVSQFGFHSVFGEVCVHYGIIQDLRVKIEDEVRIQNQKEVNHHISIMIAWDPNYNYWKSDDKRLSQDVVFGASTFGSREQSTTSVNRDIICFKELLNTLRESNNLTQEKMSGEQYMKYLSSGKKIFEFHRFVRFTNFFERLDIIKHTLMIIYLRSLMDNTSENGLLDNIPEEKRLLPRPHPNVYYGPTFEKLAIFIKTRKWIIR